jgi:uncharacterized protein
MTQALPPTVYPDSLTTFFFDAAKKRELHIQRCQSCGTYIHLPRPVCRACHSFELAGERVSGNATLYTYSVANKAFHPFFVDRVPFIVATVALAEQPHLHVISNLVGISLNDVQIGMPLRVDFEDLSDELTIPVFRAAESNIDSRVESSGVRS